MFSIMKSASDYYSSWIQSGVFIFHVGPDRRKFFIHRELLLKHSPYYKRLMDGDQLLRMGIRDKKLINLDDPRAFEVIAKWVYSRNLKIGPTVNDEVIYIKAWELAKHFEMACLRDEIMNMIRDYHRG